MARLLTQETGMIKGYELSLTGDTVLSHSQQGFVINGSKEQAIGVITHRYPRYFVLFALRHAPIKVNGKKLENNIKILHDGDELSFNDKVFLFSNGGGCHASNC